MAFPRLLLAHFASHHAVASRATMLGFGLSADQIDHLVRRGQLERVHAGVYRLAGSPATDLQRVAAACATSRFVTAAHRTAGRVWGLRRMGDDPTPEVLAPGPTSPVLRGVVVRRCHLITPRHWIDRPDGIRVTTPARTLFDLSRVLSDQALESVIEQALDRGLVRPPDLHAIGRELRTNGREGSARFGRVVHGRPAWLRPVGSDLELRVERALRARGFVQPERQREMTLPNGTRVRLDLYWPHLGLAVEIDHVTWHGGRVDSQRDKVRDRQLRRVGVTVVRITDEDVRDRLSAAVDDVVAIADEMRGAA